jgi:hypothetical protein
MSSLVTCLPWRRAVSCLLLRRPRHHGHGIRGREAPILPFRHAGSARGVIENLQGVVPQAGWRSVTRRDAADCASPTRPFANPPYSPGISGGRAPPRRRSEPRAEGGVTPPLHPTQIAPRLSAAQLCFVRAIARPAHIGCCRCAPILKCRSRENPRSRASIEIACRRQLGMPSGLGGLLRPGPLGSRGFQRLPAVDQTHPECLVLGIPRRSSKAAAFIGSSSEFFQNHVAPLRRPAQYPFSGRVSQTVSNPKRRNG